MQETQNVLTLLFLSVNDPKEKLSFTELHIVVIRIWYSYFLRKVL